MFGLSCLDSRLRLVNFGVLLLQALFEYWPETHTVAVDETDQDSLRADSPGTSHSKLSEPTWHLLGC